MPKPNWYSIKNSTDKTVEINILDEIGYWGINAQQFIDDMKAHKGKDAHVFINSPGGSVFDGVAIYNFLKSNFANVTTEVIGLAASIASIIFLAGSRRVQNDGTFLMIHNAWTMAAGDAEELRKTADIIDKISQELVTIYTEATGKSAEDIKAMMDAEKWLTAAEAVDMGFATEAAAGLKVAACARRDIVAKFQKVPAALTFVETEEQQAEPVQSEQAAEPENITEEKTAPESAALTENHFKEKKMENQIDAVQDSNVQEIKAALVQNSVVKPAEDLDKKYNAMKTREVVAAITTSGLTSTMTEEILAYLGEANPLRQYARVYNLDGTGVVGISGGVTGSWGAEGAAPSDGTQTITTVSLGAYFMNGYTVLTDRLLEQNWGDVKGAVYRDIAEYVGEQEATAMLGTGAGSDRPQGLFNATESTTSAAAAVTADEFVAFHDSLPTKYRSKAVYIMHPTTLSAIAKLQDTSKKIDLDRASGKLWGVPYILTSLAPSYAASAKILWLGDLSRAYGIANRPQGGQLIKTKMVAGTTSMTTNILFSLATDGRILDTNAFKILKAHA